MRHETRDAFGMAFVAAIGRSPIWITFLAFLFSGRFW